jgi:hypothetical protein
MLQKRRPLAADAVLDDTVRPAAPRGSDTLAEALALIDHGLAGMAYRQLLTANEVSDLLLDLRVVLLVAELEVVGPEVIAAN